MKKNISINISGIIFHVEEDGYEKLKTYLEAITRYFASYEDSKEIVDDIENRIAEVFLTKLSPTKEVITLEDVEAVMANMGSIEDFAAAEAEETEQEYRQHNRERKTYTAYETAEPKKLVRDTKRKILGGVAAGLAYYFNTDPLWIRLILLALLFSDIFVSAGTITFFTYIICWIVIPGRSDLPWDEKIKKLYRNPDDRVIGGVAGGIAAYFGTDTTLIRILFVISIFFGGLGILAYIVLWIITPEAITLTEKMQMQGEPVTLANIETTVKKNLNVNENEEESPGVKVLLFPFRLIAQIFNGLGKVAGPFLVFLAQVARIIAGLIVFFIGLAILFFMIVAAGVLLGAFSGDLHTFHSDIPVELVKNSLPGLGLIAAITVLAIPALALLLSGVALIINRKIINPAIGWSALGIWFISVAVLSFTVPPVVMEFKESGSYTTDETFDLGKKTAILTLSDVGNDYDETELRIRGTEDSVFRLEKVFRARGSSRAQATEHAQMVDYPVTLTDSILTFPSTLKFKDNAKFRIQELDMNLYVPYGQPFMIDRSLRRILRNPLYSMGISTSDLQGNQFAFTTEGLRCLTCPQRENLDNQFKSNHASGEYTKTYVVSDFDRIDIGDDFKVTIVQSDSFAVSVSGPEEYVEEVETIVSAATLNLNYEDQNFIDRMDRDPLEVVIALPTLKGITLHGGTETNISEFSGDELEIKLSGAAKATLGLQMRQVVADLSGAARLRMTGAVDELEAELSGASRLESDECEANRVELDCSGVSKARVRANEELNVEVGAAAAVDYTGNAQLHTENRRRNNIKKF